MSGLLQLIAMGIQEDPRPFQTVYTTNPNICPECVAENQVPRMYAYYGPALCTKYHMDGTAVFYNAQCYYGHYFVHGTCSKILCAIVS